MAGRPRSRRRAAGLTGEEQRTWFAYMRVALRLDYEVNRDLQAHAGLSHADFHVLNALADTPGHAMAVGDLAVRIGWERSRVSHHLVRMQARGLVDRRPGHGDRRTTEVVLTPEGLTATVDAVPGHMELVRTLFFEGLDPELLAPLRESLEQIHAQLVEHGTLPRPPGNQVAWPG